MKNDSHYAPIRKGVVLPDCLNVDSITAKSFNRLAACKLELMSPLRPCCAQRLTKAITYCKHSSYFSRLAYIFLVRDHV